MDCCSINILVFFSSESGQKIEAKLSDKDLAQPTGAQYWPVRALAGKSFLAEISNFREWRGSHGKVDGKEA